MPSRVRQRIRPGFERVLDRLVRFSNRPWIRHVPETARGFRFAGTLRSDAKPSGTAAEKTRLEAYFDAHTTGRGLWKWRHYFPIYERFFSGFVGQPVRFMEIGVYSGGSVQMWRDYFGPQSEIIGVDIEPACRAYEENGIQILIGDQGDPKFWSNNLPHVGPLDIVLDDGGHRPDQQITTLEAVLPHIRPGGIYVCEDIHGIDNEFTQYLAGLVPHLNTVNQLPNKEAVTLDAIPVQRAHAVRSTDFQRTISGIHWYPFVAVIERSACPTEALVSPMHGTEWLDGGKFWSSAGLNPDWWTSSTDGRPPE